MDNKKLLYLLAGLTLIYVLSQLFNSKKDRSFDAELLKTDTSKIDKIILHTQADGQKELALSKENGIWYAAQDGKKVKTEVGSVKNILQELVKITVKSIVTESKEKLQEYEIEDGKGSRVEVYAGSKKVADLVVGKFGFNQQAQSMISYIRKNGENKVYSIDGFQSMTFNQSFSNFRDKTIANVSDIQSVKVTSGNTLLDLSKSASSWILNQKPVDSSAVQNYISNLQSISGSEIIDGFSGNNPLHSIVVTSADKSVDIKLYPSSDSTKPFMIHSTANPDVHFKEDSNGVYTKLIKGLLDLAGTKK